jgi:hypothetical protein
LGVRASHRDNTILSPNVWNVKYFVELKKGLFQHPASARDWPFGAAASLTLTVIVMVLLVGWLRREKERLL